MIGSLKDWFQALSIRERILIAILGILIIAVAGFYGIARPFWSALENAEMQYQEAVERRARVEAKAAALSASGEGQITPIVGGLETFISQSAGETGFAIGKMDRQTDGQINMTVKSAKPTALFGWLSRLELRGVRVEVLSVSPGESGTISASLSLRSTVYK